MEAQHERITLSIQSLFQRVYLLLDNIILALLLILKIDIILRGKNLEILFYPSVYSTLLLTTQINALRANIQINNNLTTFQGVGAFRVCALDCSFGEKQIQQGFCHSQSPTYEILIDRPKTARSRKMQSLRCSKDPLN